MRISMLPALCTAIALVAGCTSVQPSTHATDVTPEVLLRDLSIVEKSLSYTDADVLALDDEMRSILAEFVDPNASQSIRLNQLIQAMIDDDLFRLIYDQKTLTARETFHRHAGNCLSFTNMFVALARVSGLQVFYQEVDIPPDWSANVDTFLLNRHVNVRVDLGIAGERIIDFNIDNFRSTYDRRQITDDRALAHFFNNKGVESLQDGDTGTALAALRQALQRDPSFAPAWNNLGTLYRRQGLHDYAEGSFREALEIDGNEYVAISNLAGLYADQGDTKRAAQFEGRARRHRRNNPYYRFELAQQDFQRRDFDAAIDNLKFAVRKKEWEDSFYFLLGLSYLQKGDQARARKWLTRAEEVAANDALKRNYQSKIDLLLSSQ